MAAETSQVRREEWLIEIITKKKERESGPRIKKVATILPNMESNKECFVPSVVSLGPLHHGCPKFSQMELYKKATAHWFISLATKEKRGEDITVEDAKCVYDEFVGKEDMSESFFRDFYGDELVDTLKVPSLKKMMFLDGCFILYFIHLVANESKDDDLSKKGVHLNRQLIIRDMFLLENQIPYSVLKALMSFMPEPQKEEDKINKFISKLFLPGYERYSEPIVNLIAFYIGSFLGLFCILLCLPIFCGFVLYEGLKGEEDSTGPAADQANDGSSADQGTDGSPSGSVKQSVDPPLHLLDHLRSQLIGEGPSSSSQPSKYWDYCSRPIRELNAIGIQVKSSKNGTLKNNVKFNSGFIISDLELPQIIVDDSTKTRLLNLVAYEMCLDAPSDCQITSYICFLDSLIHDARDVKELRSKNILLNRLGKDKDVTKLFKEMTTNLSPDYRIYREVMKGIDDHKDRPPKHVRLWIGQLIQTYFTSPWTLISLIAAISLIVLTLLQTIYSILSYRKGSS